MSGIKKLKKLMEAAESLDISDIERFRARADRIEKLLEEHKRLLEKIAKCLCQGK